MPKTKTVLEPIETKIAVDANSSVPPAEYFKDRKCLYVWDSFIDRIVNKAEATHPITYDVSSYKLTKYSTDAEIEASLPEEHIFSDTDVCAIIAALIDKQPEGEEGILGNEWWNLFYTPSFVVGVRWFGGGWFVGAWRRGYGVWGGGGRVFSPAIES